MINSFPTVYAIGHRAIDGLFNDHVIVEEKIDGSQFSFGILDGELQCRSKGKQLIIEAPEKMFNKAVETIKEIAPALHPNWIYRGEFLEKPKHNTLAYDRVPTKNIILFDINTGLERYMSWGSMHDEADRIGLEVVPILCSGKIDSLDVLQNLLDTPSILGGTKIEGFVVKNYSLFTQEKKVAMGKYVSEAFKEVHQGEWRKSNPTDADIVSMLVTQYRTPARWNKAVQHLRDAGTLTDSPKDIGNIMKEVPADILKECEEEIKEKLFKHFWPKIARGVISGAAEWYKEELLKSAFTKEGTDEHL